MMAEQFTTIYAALTDKPRLLVEAELAPVQGDRFQPTGFPDLGAATYKRADGTPMLLVESAQSMANRMEAVCWDEGQDEIGAPLKGLPHIIVDLGNGKKTSSIQEAHRLNSPYIINDPRLKSVLIGEIGDPDTGVLDIRKLAQAVMKRDVGSVLHGVFLEKVAGRLRLQRLLSSFIEARGASAVASGGVKLDRVDPAGDAAKGYGNVPFSRTEFTAQKVTAYFNFDLATMRGYGLNPNENKLLVALALFKILKVLEIGLRLRTACDMQAQALKATRPNGVDFSQHEELLYELTNALPEMIEACKFNEALFSPITAQMPPKKKAKGTKPQEAGPEDTAIEGGPSV
jgi:CRISPR-associated protein Csb1